MRHLVALAKPARMYTHTRLLIHKKNTGNGFVAFRSPWHALPNENILNWISFSIYLKQRSLSSKVIWRYIADSTLNRPHSIRIAGYRRFWAKNRYIDMYLPWKPPKMTQILDPQTDFFGRFWGEPDPHWLRFGGLGPPKKSFPPPLWGGGGRKPDKEPIDPIESIQSNRIDRSIRSNWIDLIEPNRSDRTESIRSNRKQQEREFLKNGPIISTMVNHGWFFFWTMELLINSIFFTGAVFFSYISFIFTSFLFSFQKFCGWIFLLILRLLCFISIIIWHWILYPLIVYNRFWKFLHWMRARSWSCSFLCPCKTCTNVNLLNQIFLGPCFRQDLLHWRCWRRWGGQGGRKNKKHSMRHSLAVLPNSPEDRPKQSDSTTNVIDEFSGSSNSTHKIFVHFLKILLIFMEKDTVSWNSAPPRSAELVRRLPNPTTIFFWFSCDQLHFGPLVEFIGPRSWLKPKIFACDLVHGVKKNDDWKWFVRVWQWSSIHLMHRGQKNILDFFLIKFGIFHINHG